jgi:predicted enzyme related to lactoylglutathione lyase
MRRLTALAIVLAVIVLLLVVAQLVLPGIAAQRLRDRLAKSGQVLDVHVSAFPAIELLWHQADRVVVRLRTYHSNPGPLSSLLEQTADTGSLDASASEFDTGLVNLHDAVLRKRGHALTGSATVTASDLRSALGGAIQDVQPVASGGGQLTLQGTVLGVTADATLRAENGALVVQPDVPILNFVTVTVFSDPHVEVQGVGAADAPGGFSVSANARLK